MAAPVLAVLLAVALAALAAVAWLFADGLCAHLAQRRAARTRARRKQTLRLIVVARENHGDALLTVELEAARPRWQRELRLDRRLPAPRLPRFEPGQALTLVKPGLTQTATPPQKRRYSLAAWHAHPRRYRLGIRREADGAVSSWLYAHLQVGAAIDALPPQGRFVLDPAHRDLVLVGGGIGITPMAAMTDAVAARPHGRRVWLHYAARGQDELIDDARYRTLDTAHAWFHYRPILSRPGAGWAGATGRLDAARLMAGLPDPRAAHYYFCAREDMMHALMDALAEAGVPRAQLHWESFGGGENSDASVYPVRFNDTDYRFEGQPHLLAAFDEWGVNLPADCRAGECGACRVRLLAGEVAACQASHCALPPGEILACCAAPRTALVLARVA